jgi:2-polyprenyl-3-methyl-5-hydroxy-6-metoxy-1,4-benzoquinol methylase
MANIVWTDDSEPLKCRVCGYDGPGTLFARVTALSLEDHALTRCPECKSVEILGEPLDSSPTDDMVDSYVEAGAGISTIAEAFELIDRSKVERFLDVGCNYGFALDIARHEFGWDVTGIEPSHAAVRGSAELGVRILPAYLTEETQGLGTFDLVLASEVVEHVPDPVPFLRAIRAVLGPDGVVLITTPAAEIITRDHPIADALAALSPGYHSFVASASGLSTLLERAGFEHVRVTRRSGSLIAVASQTALTDLPEQVDAINVLSYLAWRAGESPRSSALRSGMATRALRLAVARGDFETATRMADLAVEVVRNRHRVNLANPQRALARLRSAESSPWVLAGTSFALGMIELLNRNNPARASLFFEIARTAEALWSAQVEVVDLDTIDLRYQSVYHLALARARSGAAGIDEAARDLIRSAEWAPNQLAAPIGRSRVFSELVHRGRLPVERSFQAAVEADAPALAAGEGDARVAGLDALYSLGIAQRASGSSRAADRLLRACASACLDGALDSHATNLIQLCIANLGELTDAGVPPLHYSVEQYWCDAHGTFLSGWVHADAVPLGEIRLVGDTDVLVSRGARPDLLAHWPLVADPDSAGFSAYLPGRPRDIRLVAVSPLGDLVARVALPPESVPSIRDDSAAVTSEDRAASFVHSAPEGALLAIGMRSTSRAEFDERISKFGRRATVGFDIHEGIGVDVVGDAHQLSEHFAANQFPVVYSANVLEHLSAPWLFALECAKITQVGGYGIHVAPWAWPTHATPNDFWRMSEAGLRMLFSAELGYRVLAAGEVGSAVMIPGPTSRQSLLTMPTTGSSLGSWIVVQKIDDRARNITWPYDRANGTDRARQYPRDGLASWVSL